MRAGLKAQFIVMTIALVVITVFGSSYFLTRQERDVLLREITRRGVTIARNLSVISTDSLIANDSLALATFVDSIMKNEGVVYGMIVNEKGMVLAHNQIENVGKTYVEPAGVRPLTNEELLIQSFTNENKEQVIDIALSVLLRNGIRIGVVHVGMSQRAIDQTITEAARESMLISGLLLLFGVIIAVILTTFMLRPVGDLLTGVRAIGQGNLNYKINIKGAKELMILGSAFNEMAGHLKELYIGVLRAMAKALESRDKSMAGHDQRVLEHAVRCAEHLQLSREEVDNIRLAAQVQNLGHIAVPDAILEKTGKLTPEEYEKLKEHSILGADILNQVPALRGAVPLVLHHHERFDGRGYPKGMIGKNIPLGARILAVADAYDAMTSAQKYREPIPPEQALQELKRGAGSQFDPEIVDAFIEAITQPQEGK